MLYYGCPSVWTPCFLGLHATYQPNRPVPLYLPSRFLQNKGSDIFQLTQPLQPHCSPGARLLQCGCRSLRYSATRGCLVAGTTPALHDLLQCGDPHEMRPIAGAMQSLTEGRVATHPLPSSFSTTT